MPVAPAARLGLLGEAGAAPEEPRRVGAWFPRLNSRGEPCRLHAPAFHYLVGVAERSLPPHLCAMVVVSFAFL